MLTYYSRLAWLNIKKTPFLSSLMVLAIAIGIGVTMTVLTVYYLMGKDPIPEKSDKLFAVQLNSYGPGNSYYTEDGFQYQLTYPDAMNIHASDVPLRKTRSLKSGLSVIPEGEGKTPFIEMIRAIDSDFFAMFNVPFIHGGPWSPDVDTKPGNYVVIGKHLNDRLFDGKNSVGKNLNLNQQLYTITGVIDDWRPAPLFYDLNGSHFNKPVEILIPFSLLPVHKLASWGDNVSWKAEVINTYEQKLQSETFWIQYWVELKDEQQKDDYNNWLGGYIEQQQKSGRFQHENAGPALRNVMQWLDYNGVVSEDNTFLLNLAFLFLLVCIFNTIGLLLGKFMKNTAHVGVRRALGASQHDIFFQHLVEVGLIGLLGGVLGLALGEAGLMAIRILYSSYEALSHMDYFLVFAAIGISLCSALLAGLFPAWQVCRTNPSIYLKMQ